MTIDATTFFTAALSVLTLVVVVLSFLRSGKDQIRAAVRDERSDLVSEVARQRADISELKLRLAAAETDNRALTRDKMELMQRFLMKPPKSEV